ncbi:hypothetical protein B0H11DRAFT_2327238 [Mycena galericulata]|nr:hypothetical protein B0H11DRAFT_2327238 [Mycena galericulata]
MSNSAQPSHNLSHPAPYSHSCVTTEQPPENPCERCARRKLPCEYVTVIEQEEYSTPNNTSSELRRDPGEHSAPPPPPPPPTTWTPPVAPHNTSPGNSNAPRLSHTGPPPPNRHPRYSSSTVPGFSEYPDLSLPVVSRGSGDPQYSSSMAPSYHNTSLSGHQPNAMSVDPRHLQLSRSMVPTPAHNNQRYDLGDPRAHQYFSGAAQSLHQPQTAHSAPSPYAPGPGYNPIFYGGPPGPMQGDQWTREFNPSTKFPPNDSRYQ